MCPLQLNTLEATLAAAQSAIRCALNSHSAVNELPNELLGLVFAHVPSTSFPRHSDGLFTRDHYDPVWTFAFAQVCELIPVTHVCRRWREVALGQSTLWNSIDAATSRGTGDAQGVLLKRSKSAPLNVYVRDVEGRALQALFRSDGHRIRELGVCDIVDQPKVFSYLDFPAPQLERLMVRATEWAGLEVTPSTPILFQGDAPRLRSLTLGSGCLSWLPGNHFGNLVHLCISLCRSATWRPSALLELLGRCPQLEEFILSEFDSDVFYADLPKVTLARLRRLALRLLRPNFTRVFLSLLNLPSNLAIDVCEGFSADAVMALDRSLLQTLSDMDMTAGMTRLKIKIDEGKLSFGMVGPSSGMRLDLIPFEDAWDLRWVLQVCRVFRAQLSGIRELWIVSDHWDDEAGRPAVLDDTFGGTEVPGAVLGALPSLTTLTMCTQYVANISDWLNVLATEPMLCPELATLHIVLDGDPPALPTNLNTVASVRAAYGHPIRRLIVEYRPAKDESPDFDQKGLEALIDSVDSNPSQSRPSMELPEICRSEASLRVWPEW
ncbi:hypothetical protein B0H21DRAFT_546047 [Amylocystis lapponica]|nr:hypothetical protein B0H21DRAFT_546047 [Amylocystis lapponica]